MKCSTQGCGSACVCVCSLYLSVMCEIDGLISEAFIANLCAHGVLGRKSMRGVWCGSCKRCLHLRRLEGPDVNCFCVHEGSGPCSGLTWKSAYLCVCCCLTEICVILLGLARTVYIYTVYDRGIYGDFPAKNTVYTPYIYGSGQPYA